MKHTTCYVLYVGSEKDASGRALPAEVIAHALRRIEHLTASAFGGYTFAEAYGGWMNDVGTLVRERSYRFEVVTDVSAAAVRRWADTVRVAFEQGSVLLTSHTQAQEMVEEQAAAAYTALAGSDNPGLLVSPLLRVRLTWGLPMSKRDGNTWLVSDTQDHDHIYILETRWGVSRGRDTYGYNICSLYVDGKKAASCNGGGYDMSGTVIGDWIERKFAKRIHEQVTREFYGLTFHDPNFNPAQAEVPGTGQTVAQREAQHESFGLERYQAFYGASSKMPTERHTIPLLDGACGLSCMITMGEAIGLKFDERR